MPRCVRLLAATVCAVALAGPAPAAAEQTPPAATAPPASEWLRQALRLQGNGFEEDARKLVKEAVRQSATPVPPQLRSPEQRLGWWREALGTVGPLVRTALEMAAVALGFALVVVLVGLMVVTGIKGLVQRFCRAARLDGFAGSDDTTVPPLLGAALSEVLERMSDDKPGQRLTWTSGTEHKFELPTAIMEAVPTANLLAGLVQMVDKLLYRNLYLVSGTVHPPHEHRGAGVTLVVANRSGRESKQVTVWESEFMLKEAGERASEAVRYERLILPAAVWLAYRPMLGFKEGDAPLGAREWRSYALFALGELVPDPVKQRRLYEQALDFDSQNLGARLNLADLLMRRPRDQVAPGGERAETKAGSSEGWPERLKEAGTHLEAVMKSATPDQPIWYRARYMEARRCLYLSPPHVREARKALKELTEAFCSGGMRKTGRADDSDPLSKKPPPQRDRTEAPCPNDDSRRRLRPLTDAMRRPVDILERSVDLIETESLGGLDELRSGWLSEDAEYNLAYLLSLYAKPLKGEARASATAEAVRDLRRAIARNPKLAAQAEVDPAFDPIRDDAAFQAVVRVAASPATVKQSTSFAITLDPGPQLTKLFSRAGT